MPQKVQTQPLLSIAVPTYNRAAMLRDCIKSLLAAPAEAEIIVSDNASPDNTAEIVAALAARDPRIRYVRNTENIGIVGNFNNAIGQGKGAYLTVIGDDDTSLPRNYHAQLEILESHPEIGLVYSRWNDTDENNRNPSLGGSPGLVNYSYIGGRDEFRDLFLGNYMRVGSVVFRRSLWDKLGGYDARFDVMSDWDLLLRYCFHTQTAFINEPLYNVRASSWSSSVATGRSEHKFLQNRLAIWREWLLFHEEPVIFDDRWWTAFEPWMRGEVQYAFGDADPQLSQLWMAQLEHLHREYDAKRSLQFGIWLRAPGPAPKHRGKSTDLPLLRWTGPVGDAGPRAEAQSFVDALAEAHVPARLEDVLALDEARKLPRPAGDVPGYIRVWQVPASCVISDAEASATVGRPICDASWNVDDWLRVSPGMDMIWAPSSFHAGLLTEAGIAPAKVRVLAPAIDVRRFEPSRESAALDTGKSFNFLAVLDWGFHPGAESLIAAWTEMFAADEDVALILVLIPRDGKSDQQVGEELQALFRRKASGPTATIRARIGAPPYGTLPPLHRAVQAYIQANVGECWDSHVVDAMASGLPVIAGAWGPNLEFMAESNAYLVDCGVAEAVPAPADRTRPTRQIAEPIAAQLAARMRMVFTQRAEAHARGEVARADVAARFGLGAVGQQARALITELWSIRT